MNQEKKDFGQKVLKRLEEKKIKPKPKWEFELKNYSVWLGVVLSLVASSLCFAVIFYMFKNSDWDLYQQTSHGFFEFIFFMIPYVWLFFLAILIFLVYFNLKHTKRGYRLSLQIIIAGAFLSSIILGLLFYGFGLGREIDEVFSHRVPFYNTLLRHRVMMWQSPEEGLLTGLVIEINGDKNFKLQDLRQKIWEIIADESLYGKTIELEPGVRVKVFGQKIKEDQFKAQIIRPILGPGGGLVPVGGMMTGPGFHIMINR